MKLGSVGRPMPGYRLALLDLTTTWRKKVSSASF